jgi:MoxR-like ATPase
MEELAESDELAVVRRTTSAEQAELHKVVGAADLMAFSGTIRSITLPPALGQYIVDLVAATRPADPSAPAFVREYVVWGAGLRASQNIALAAKSRAAQNGHRTVDIEDVRAVVHPVMRHRIGLSFRAEVDRITIDEIIRRVLAHVPAPSATGGAA